MEHAFILQACQLPQSRPTLTLKPEALLIWPTPYKANQYLLQLMLKLGNSTVEEFSMIAELH
jgi:hypothetical protein